MIKLFTNIRLRIILSSLVLGIFILTLKMIAARMTGSAALQSDAIESIVNVVAAAFALAALLFSERPADRSHPYGHGKMEYFSSAFEGGLIGLAAVFILMEAFQSFFQPKPLQFLGWGLLINLAAGGLNGLLGVFLFVSGKKHRSKALESDGVHLLTDFLTTVGVGLGIVLLMITHWVWIDACIAAILGTFLLITGVRIVNGAAMALLDQEDSHLLTQLTVEMNKIRPDSVIAIHEMRSMRSGRKAYIDTHVVVPEFYTVSQAHDLVEGFTDQVLTNLGIEAEFHNHLDPCHRQFCANCALSSCSIRKQNFESYVKFDIETVTAKGLY